MAKDSISRALGITDDWVNDNLEKIGQEFDDAESISDVIENTALRIKSEEFGEGEYTLSEYEKKLLFAGLQIGNVIVQMRKHSMANDLFDAILQEAKKRK